MKSKILACVSLFVIFTSTAVFAGPAEECAKAKKVYANMAAAVLNEQFYLHNYNEFRPEYPSSTALDTAFWGPVNTPGWDKESHMKEDIGALDISDALRQLKALFAEKRPELYKIAKESRGIAESRSTKYWDQRAYTEQEMASRIATAFPPVIKGCAETVVSPQPAKPKAANKARKG